MEIHRQAMIMTKTRRSFNGATTFQSWKYGPNNSP